MYHHMKCTDSDVSLVLSKSQYVHENTEFSLQSFSSKSGHLDLSLFLFLVKYSVGNKFLELAHMQFPIQDHYIHTSRHRKDTIRSKWTLFCVCSYVCNALEWETACEQAPKKGFQQNISQGREREKAS